jgi:hypothetical protein
LTLRDLRKKAKMKSKMSMNFQESEQSLVTQHPSACPRTILAVKKAVHVVRSEAVAK